VIVCKASYIERTDYMKLFINGEQINTCSFQDLSAPTSLIFGVWHDLTQASISIQVGGVAMYGNFSSGVPEEWWDGSHAWLNYMIEKYRYKL